MSGCFLFLQRLAGRRGRGGRAGPARAGASPRCSLECGLGGGLAAPRVAPHGFALSTVRPGSSAHLHLATSSTSSLDGAASPLSDSGSYSSCDSASLYPSPCSSGSLGGLGSGGAPSPTGHVRRGCDSAEHEAALKAACEILLVEHQLDTKEYCLFVHKRLRPIRTRPEDKSRPAPEKPGLLRELITNSFTFQHDPELRAQLAASMAAATSAGGSGASSITFQQAAAAATGVEVM